MTVFFQCTCVYCAADVHCMSMIIIYIYIALMHMHAQIVGMYVCKRGGGGGGGGSVPRRSAIVPQFCTAAPAQM